MQGGQSGSVWFSLRNVLSVLFMLKIILSVSTVIRNNMSYKLHVYEYIYK